MKTIEEIKNAVAAYSNQHIPHYGDAIAIGKIEFTRSTVTKRNFAISFLDENGDSTTIWLAETISATDARWQLFYSVLGLAKRDAVAEKGARIQELRDEIARLTHDQETNCEEYVKTLTEDANYGLNQVIAAKDAEIKRLREGIQKVADHLWVRDPKNMSWLELRDQASILYGLLSPATVTEGKFPKLIQSDVLPPNHFMGMGDDGKPFIGLVSTDFSPKNEDQE